MNEGKRTPGRLEQSLGHRFRARELLETALTHRSFGTPHNERLEFLGDGILNCVIADLLFCRFPALNEGDLSRLRANLVRQDTLVQLAEQLGVGQFLRLGDGERKSGGNSRPSILADAVEALFGGVYLDAGFDTAKGVIGRLYSPLIDAIDLSRAIKDAKTRLQEYLQAKRIPLPLYTVISTHGDAHAQEFEVTCEIAALAVSTSGRGASRRIAEQRAAESALSLIEAKESR